jgi:hypothetical protein
MDLGKESSGGRGSTEGFEIVTSFLDLWLTERKEVRDLSQCLFLFAAYVPGPYPQDH